MLQLSVRKTAIPKHVCCSFYTSYIYIVEQQDQNCRELRGRWNRMRYRVEAIKVSLDTFLNRFFLHVKIPSGLTTA